MTLKEAYEYGQVQLKNAQIEDADLDAWYLLEYVTGVSRTMYFMDMNCEVSEEEEREYFRCVETRATHVPLQHITGVQEFMGLPFYVNEHGNAKIQFFADRYMNMYLWQPTTDFL